MFFSVIPRWSSPLVELPLGSLHRLDSAHFLVTVAHSASDGTVVNGHNLTEPSLILDGPLWGLDYEFRLVCVHQGLEAECGRERRVAKVDAKEECFR